MNKTSPTFYFIAEFRLCFPYFVPFFYAAVSTDSTTTAEETTTAQETTTAEATTTAEEVTTTEAVTGKESFFM